MTSLQAVFEAAAKFTGTLYYQVGHYFHIPVVAALELGEAVKRHRENPTAERPATVFRFRGDLYQDRGRAEQAALQHMQSDWAGNLPVAGMLAAAFKAHGFQAAADLINGVLESQRYVIEEVEVK